MIRVSAGTAALVGLQKTKQAVAPTTAYLMCGQKCVRSCAFCAQAKDAVGRTDSLSRITWPAFEIPVVVDRIAEKFEEGELSRVCVQMVLQPGTQDKVLNLISTIKSKTTIPLSVSAGGSRKDIDALFKAGADRVSIALDAATERIFSKIKGKGWRRTFDLLCYTAATYPGRVSTHLIVGLGETDEEFLSLVGQLLQRDITIGLFAFTPVRGSRMQSEKQPPLSRYRALQAAVYLLLQEPQMLSLFEFSDGRLSSFGRADHQLRVLLASGEAFMTSGCSGCNRPYYNERPGTEFYNYPTKLDDEQRISATEQALSWVKGEVLSEQ